ncbi:MAG TPA: nuclear transport factor 2 family protein [Solirubrobacteraceae bacterium]|nr:nuclear transport factor 2 family protein [Solirubrobacteraceae bacterium]
MNTVDTPTRVDAVARFCAAAGANDLEGMLATLAPDAELISPLSARLVIRGRADLGVLLGAVYSSLSDLRWEAHTSEGSFASVIGAARSSGMRVDDALVFELGPDGSIVRLRPHLRPWLGTTVFALKLGLKLAPHAGVMLRAARAGAAARHSRSS